jgi:hypothetical protein
MTTFKVSTVGLNLLAIACIMLVVVQVTEAARELDDGVGAVLVNREHVAPVHTKAGLTVLEAAASELLRLPYDVQSSNDPNCDPRGATCYAPGSRCCSGSCDSDYSFLPGLCN